MNESIKATLGGGCFWCLEAVFQQIPGVKRVVSGYAGGTSSNPSYQAICGGNTGHAEVIHIEYDLVQTDYPILLDWFWRCHDPTTLNRQGADAGTQYRSVIFCHNKEQLKQAQSSKKDLENSEIFKDPVVTEISLIPEFYPAEDYHQNYYQENSAAGYCQFVIRPKMQKLGFE
jgi:peptide-methionine (S)-S-oxide reductase